MTGSIGTTGGIELIETTGRTEPIVTTGATGTPSRDTAENGTSCGREGDGVARETTANASPPTVPTLAATFEADGGSISAPPIEVVVRRRTASIRAAPRVRRPRPEAPTKEVSAGATAKRASRDDSADSEGVTTDTAMPSRTNPTRRYSTAANAAATSATADTEVGAGTVPGEEAAADDRGWAGKGTYFFDTGMLGEHRCGII
ncbi:hypothetical protein [Haladaptatus salinisoli]|uniref:hypothetical protein n=1 Tax=Haladaptatus salinisoli TaxID=2884876 RepID=UPI001D0A513B|nr:hypothetical protein [Haladaptatus salinisoli]